MVRVRLSQSPEGHPARTAPVPRHCALDAQGRSPPSDNRSRDCVPCAILLHRAVFRVFVQGARSEAGSPPALSTPMRALRCERARHGQTVDAAVAVPKRAINSRRRTAFLLESQSAHLSQMDESRSRQRSLMTELGQSRLAGASCSSCHVRNALPAQPVDATQALNLSAGVSNPKVFRGRSLS